MYDINYFNAKMYIPSIKSNYVSREVLIGKMNEREKKEHKVILVSAEAGYGKTTLVSEWISRIKQRYTWLSLDEYDNDPITFINYLVMAIKKVDDTFGSTIENILSTPKLPGVEVISSYIIEELSKLKHTFTLIFDDYHIITNIYIHKILQRIIDSKAHNILTIILTRQDPPFNLSRWRAGDILTELRSSDLRFEPTEIKEFFIKSFNINFENETLQILEERTEGWAAGLQLIGLSLRNIKKEEQGRCFIKQINGNNRFVTDYLMEEVFERQETQIQEFLKKTSILKSFNEELCNTITGLNCSRQILDRLERDNLFLVPLDCNRTWYRYHHLFSEFLRTGLDETLRAEICRKASAWCENKGFIELAFEYALEARDCEMALSLVNQVSSKYLYNGAIETLLEHLNSVKEISDKTDAEIETCRAWCLFLLGETDKAYKTLKELKSMQVIKASNISGRIQALEAILYTNIDKSKAVMLAEEAVSILKGENRLFYNIALRTLGLVKVSVGESAEAAAAFKKIIYGINCNKYRLVELSAFVNYTDCLIAMGRRQEAQSLCEELLAEYIDQYGDRLPMARVIYLTLGICFYIGNELEKAKKYLYEGINFCREMKLMSTIGNAEGFYVKLLFILGEKSIAFKTLYKYKRLSKRSRLQNIFEMLEAIEIDLSIKERNHTKVLEWTKKREVLMNDNLCPYPSNVKLTYIRALISQKKFNEAETKLENEEELARKYNKQEQLITILILTALVKKYNGDQSRALMYIREALKIAAPEGYVRNFLDEDEEVLALVRKARNAAPEFVDQLEEQNTLQVNVLIEPLKAREYEILKLIAAGMSNAEIAANLYITIGTVKWYIKNIFTKLGVNKRTQAVKKARQLEILI